MALIRIKRSAFGAGSSEGDQEVTLAVPRIINGMAAASATPRSARPDFQPFRQTRQRPVRPTVRQTVGRGGAVLDQVLSVEVGTIAVGRGDGMEQDQLAFPIAIVQAAKLRRKAEEAVEVQRRLSAAARSLRADAGAGGLIVRIAERGRGGQPVHRSAQEHDDEPLVARPLGEGDTWEGGGGDAGGETAVQRDAAVDLE